MLQLNVVLRVLLIDMYISMVLLGCSINIHLIQHMPFCGLDLFSKEKNVNV